MQSHSIRLDELAFIDKKLTEMETAAACYSDPLAEVRKFLDERIEAVKKDMGVTNPMVPKGKEVYAE